MTLRCWLPATIFVTASRPAQLERSGAIHGSLALREGAMGIDGPALNLPPAPRRKFMKFTSATVLVAVMSCLAMPAEAQQCRSYTSAALIGLVEIRCSNHMVTTPHGEKTYDALVRTGIVEAASCATAGARTREALGDLGFMTATAMIDELAGTSFKSPKNAQTLTKQCNALAKVLDSMSPDAAIYRKK